MSDVRPLAPPGSAADLAALDPRHRNDRFDLSSLAGYLHDYADELARALRSVDAAALDAARRLIEETAAAGGCVHSIGNGGSAAIADHLCCDLTKGTDAAGHPSIATRSLVSNVALYSAIANDFGFETVFSRQVQLLAKPGDALIAISSSGNSPNILAGVAAARAAGVPTIGLSGFSGGALRQAADIVLHVDVANYGIVEDAHQALMHVLAQFIAARRDGTPA